MRSLICFAAFAVFFISASASHGDSLSDQQAQGLVTCNHQPTQDFLDFSEELRIQESKESSLSLPPSVSIDTWYHVVAANKTLKGGWVSVSPIPFRARPKYRLSIQALSSSLVQLQRPTNLELAALLVLIVPGELINITLRRMKASTRFLRSSMQSIDLMGSSSLERALLAPSTPNGPLT